jgi:endoglucanase
MKSQIILVVCSSLAAAAAPRVVLNQLGFRPGDEKHALGLELPPDAGLWSALDGSGEVVASGAVGRATPDPLSHLGVSTIDLSSLRTPGQYRLRVGTVDSAAFEVGDGALVAGERLMLRSYLLQRCGVALDDAETGLSHPACHLADATTRDGGRAVLTGGWHDAGDYGKYVATTAVTLARLLFLFERAPERFPDGQLQLGPLNHRSDLVDELVIGIEWMLAMQRDDGAVYRKLSGHSWPADVGPADDRQERFTAGPGTADTAKWVAVMAQAARVLSSAAPELAARCRRGAERGQAWLVKHPLDAVDWSASDDTGSGGYLKSAYDSEPSLRTDADDRLWANVELWLLDGTGPTAALEAQCARATPGTFEWKDASAFAFQELAVSRKATSRLRALGRAQVVAQATRALQRSRSNAWGLASLRFIWGSNKLVAEEGVALLLAAELTADRRFRQAGLRQLDYLLGQNPFGVSFVTGLGERAVRHPNHLFGRSAHVQIPGLVVGGPNESDPSGRTPQGKGMLSWVDDDHAYGSNEYAIDYEAPVIALLELALSSGR